MPPISILYLEDSPLDFELSMSLLQQSGIECEVVRVDTEEAFESALRNRSYDLILADYVLPAFDGVSGLEMARKLAPETPFVFVSGAIGEEFAIESMQRGATDYVLKSRLKRLVPAVRRALTEAAERKARRRAEEERQAILQREQAARARAEIQARELAQVNAELEQFAYAASHDLQEPLRMVRIYAQLLARQNRETLDEDGLKYIAFIEQGVERMENLIRDLLSYSRLVHEWDRRVRPVDLDEVLRQTLQDLAPRIEETGARVTHDPMPVVHAEGERISHVLLNLLSNAIKYRNSTPPEIHVSAVRSNGDWRISVRDNGTGFEPRHAERIFGLFKRLHGKDVPGTGVGLALARKIIEQHGGRIWAESEPGRGATFHFTLPDAKSTARE